MDLLKKIVNRDRILSNEIREFVDLVVKGEVSPVYAGAVLTGLAMRGVEEDVLIGVVQALYGLCEVDYGPCDGMDTCGTGGSGRLKYNTSSAVAITLWSMGLRIAKHGNRSASGRFGSADAFSLAGWPIDLSPNRCVEVFEEKGFAFLFAPKFFPAMKAFAGVRKELGIRTVFNLAGPLANPFRVRYQIVGVSSGDLLDLFASVLLRLGRSALVFSSLDGLDEFHPFSPIDVRLVKDGKVESFELSPSEVVDKKVLERLKEEDCFPARVEDVKDGFVSFIQGRAPLGFRVMTAMNSALGLYLMGRAKTVKDGFSEVMDLLESKGVAERWQDLIGSLRNS